ncbi:MAG: peptidylprolyl isomerase [Bacteroidaceae bacterium]|nr:peptidylprolyl isomerase [Bacteroidaceae bacterium]MBQ8888813.1 peptidylprolyl isomerase [Bacteroidaceae bacterium]
MKTNHLFILAVIVVVLAACGAGSKKSNNMEKRTQVKIETTQGNIVVELYNETPKHRDNFIKLVKEGLYDSTLFHRVISQFMIQAGDPDSKTASDTATLGGGDVGYTVPAEIVPQFIHKRGALAAARMGDDVNPERASSGCQFYIVTGRKFRETQLLNLAGQRNNQRTEEIFNELARKHMKEIFKLRKANDQEALMELQDSLEAQAYAIKQEEEPFMFTPEQISAYTTVGGAPHLDGAYTVFGQVIEGMDTVEKIEGAKTGRADRPVMDIRILKATVIE